MKKHYLISAIFALIYTYPHVALSDYIFTAPPRESLEKGNKVYKPISDFLSEVTGERFIYEHPKNWEEYSAKMHSEHYDLLFDGPHFIDWRIKNLNHEALIKLPQLIRFRVIARKNDTSINSLKDATGKKACAPGTPNFAMLSMFSHFTDPDKQPVHIKVKGWKNVYNAVLNNQCDIGVIPKTNLAKFDKHGENIKILHTHLPYPNQGFTAGGRISPRLTDKVLKALLSAEGQEILSNLRKRYGAGAELVRASNEEYDGVRYVLQRAENFKFKKDKESPLAKY